MKKISKEEAARIKSHKAGKKHPVNTAIENMEAGETWLVTRADFKWKKRTPVIFCNRIARRTGKKFACADTIDKNGWVVERLA